MSEPGKRADDRSGSPDDRIDWDARVDWVAKHQAYFHCPAYRIDGWVPFEAVRIPVDDLGFRQGVTAVERLRTRRGQPFLLPEHLERMVATVAYLNIASPPTVSQLSALVAECLERNRTAWIGEAEVGVTIWVTPGAVGSTTPGPNSAGRTTSGPTTSGPTTSGPTTSGPTWCVHLNPIRRQMVKERLASGQPVVVTDVRQPPPESWSRQAKVRCRLHYFRADQIAQSIEPKATGLLLDTEGGITESNIANVAMVKNGQIVSPPSDRVLAGVTMSFARRVANRIGITWTEQAIFPHQLLEADEVLLMGTDTGVWPACSVELVESLGSTRRDFGQAAAGRTTIGRRLQSAFPV